MALATYLRGLLGKSSFAKPIRPSRLNRVNLALETLESRWVPAISVSSVVNSLYGDNTAGVGSTPLLDSSYQQTLHIAGSGFQSQTIHYILFTNQAHPATTVQSPSHFVSSDSLITANYPPGMETGKWTVTVGIGTGPVEGSTAVLDIKPPQGVVSPDSGTIQGGSTITIHGKYLYNASNVLFGAQAASQFNPALNTDSQITVTTPPSALPVPGTGKVDVLVSFPGASSNFKVGDFAYTIPTVPAWNFTIPKDVANLGFQIAIFGQKTSNGIDANGDYVYWNGTSWADANNLGSGSHTIAPLITLAPAGTSLDVTASIALPAWNPSDTTDPQNNYLIAGAVAMFVGNNMGIPISGGKPSSPTVQTNPADIFSLFELTYASNAYDVDISNVDQLGFTYTVTSSSVDGQPVGPSNPSAAPIPLATVGSSLDRATLFNRFQAAFPAPSPFNESYAAGNVNGQQVRLLAPQDVILNINKPVVPPHIGPAKTTGANLATANTYWYLITETNQYGETMGSPPVFGGYLLDKDGNNPAGNNSIPLGWNGPYTPVNPSATGIKIYRALAPASNSPTPPVPPPPNPVTPFYLLNSLTIEEFNNLPGQVFIDNGSYTPDTGKTPPVSSYSFSPLSSWFNDPLWDTFSHFSGQTFSFYQSNQSNGAHGTLWTGKVLDVTPNSANPITALQYVSSATGQPTSITTQWQNWNDAPKQTYKVLQLVGNAYDSSDWSNPNPPGNPASLTPGQYEGAVVNIYFPFFQENTGLSSVPFHGGANSYPAPAAPTWLPNSTFTPGQMVFGCAGAFASYPGDPEAQAQQATFPDLAKKAMTNLENVLVSALNRGVATGYDYKLAPQQWISPINFSQYPVTSTPGADIYTYFLSAILPDGQTESVLGWPLSIGVNTAGSPSVTLNWLPQGNQVYKTANIYRQDPSGTIRLVGTVDNATSLAQTFTDNFISSNYPPAPTTGAPFTFYPDWKDTTAPGFVNSNLFSAFLHQNFSADPLHGVSINGLCYGYPFDDQGGFSTNIDFGNAPTPKTITFAISPFTTSVQPVVTTATLSSNNNPSHLNDAVTFTATVSPASGTVAPSGTVSFYDGNTLIGTGTLKSSGLNAIASFTTSSLTVGAHSITASYSGSNAFDPSTSSVLSQTVDGTPPSPLATSTTLASNINPANLDQTITFTATVTAAKGIPSGTVNFLDGTTLIGTGTLNTQGFATFQTSTLAVGTHLITAAFQASATYSASTSSVVKQVVAPDGPASTATTLVPNPNPTYAGHTVTFTSTVAAKRGTKVPTGTVTFLVDGTVVGSAQLSNGVATLQHAFATAGTYSLTANYQGDTSFAESQSPTATEVVNQPSSSTVKVTLSSSVNPSTQGQMVLFTAKLQPVAGSGSPTGTVDFYVNNVWQNSTTVFTDGSYGQVATWLTNALPLGDNSITAKYRGDSSFDPANSKPLSQVVTANPNQIMQPADLGPGSYVAGVGNLLAIKPSFGEMQFFQPFPNYNGQITVNTMDRDSDGKADTILAAVAGGAAPHVLVIDANTGYLLSSFYAFSQSFLGGVTIAGGPVHLAPTGSATPVVVCGARAGAQPTVAVFDALGNDYGAFFAFDPAYKGGVNVAMSEANAQGNALVVVSSTINTHVKVFDIANVQPSELASYYTFGSANYSPGVWASAGDIDGNATQELLVGTAGGTAAARIKVYNLLTGAEIPGKVIKPFGDNYLGSVRVGLSDYNRDGVLDLLAASGPMAMGTVRAFDFNTLAELESLFVSNVTDGVFIATNFSRAGVPT